jgi:Ca2+-binding RTX toxin-like protein
MAIFRFFPAAGGSPGVGADSVEYLFYLRSLGNLVISDQQIRLFSTPGKSAVLTGDGFAVKYDGGALTIIRGEINTISAVFLTGPLFTASGLNLGAKEVFSLLAAGDDNAVAAYVFKGNDQLFGTGLSDTVEGLGGNDRILGLGGSDMLYGGVGGDRIEGGNGKDGVSGDAGNDALYGGGSLDEIAGRDGNDRAFGGRGGDFVSGGNGKDVLFGGGGDDFLYGGKQSDTLTGNAGADGFTFFDSLGPDNIDRVTDFQPGSDKIYVDPVLFGLPFGPLAATAFRKGAAALDADDRIIYNPANGALIFDSNGNAAGGRTVFGFLDAGLNMKVVDFEVGLII